MDKKIEYRKIYYENHKLKYLEYYNQNKDVYKQRYLNYYEKNRSKINEYNKQYWKSYCKKNDKLLINDNNHINNSVYPSDYRESYKHQVTIIKNVRVTF